MYNAAMFTRLLMGVLLLVAASGCSRTREVEKDLKMVDVRTGWYDAGIVAGGQNKLVPGIAFKFQNVSADEISRVQVNAVFHRATETEPWGDRFANAIGPDALAAGATGGDVVLVSALGYTGTESRAQMLANSQFVDARVEVFGKHGSRNWVKVGEFSIDRRLLTEQQE